MVQFVLIFFFFDFFNFCWVFQKFPFFCVTLYFCRTLDKFTRKAKPIRMTGEPNNQRPAKWRSSTVHEIFGNRHCGFKCHYI